MRAFSDRAKPARVIRFDAPVTPEEEDALWFANRSWDEITKEDWRLHSDAFFWFTPEAFVYYLPSILAVALEDERNNLLVTNSLLNILDRSPTVEYWDTFLVDRLGQLNSQEYEAIQSWLLELSGRSINWDEDSLTRCYETVELLKQHAKS